MNMARKSMVIVNMIMAVMKIKVMATNTARINTSTKMKMLPIRQRRRIEGRI